MDEVEYAILRQPDGRYLSQCGQCDYKSKVLYYPGYAETRVIEHIHDRHKAVAKRAFLDLLPK